MLFNGSIEEHWVTMHMHGAGFSKLSSTSSTQMSMENMTKKNKSVLMLLSLLLPYCCYFFKGLSPQLLSATICLRSYEVYLQIHIRKSQVTLILS